MCYRLMKGNSTFLFTEHVYTFCLRGKIIPAALETSIATAKEKVWMKGFLKNTSVKTILVSTNPCLSLGFGSFLCERHSRNYCVWSLWSPQCHCRHLRHTHTLDARWCKCSLHLSLLSHRGHYLQCNLWPTPKCFPKIKWITVRILAFCFQYHGWTM